MKATLLTTLTLIGIASPALAAAGAQEHSGLLVWAFIGFFGLIVVAQLVPAFLVLFGVAKSFGREQQHQIN